MFVTQALKRAVQINANGTATVYGDRRRTWSETRDQVQKLAGALRGLGLQPGGRVAILSLNSDRYFEFYYGVPWAGGVVVPLNTRLAPPELVYILNDAGPEILLIDENFRDMALKIRAELKTVKHMIYMGDDEPPQGMQGYAAIVEAALPAEDAMRGGDDLMGIFYTGGTTGLPKGVMLSHTNIALNALGSIISLKLEGIFLHSAPMFHLADGTAVFGITANAGTHIILPGFDPKSSLEAIQKHRITFGLFVPTMVGMLVNSPELAKTDVSSLEYILYGASPMPLAVLEDALNKFAGVKFIHGYGMTETSPLLTGLDPYYHTPEGRKANKLKSAGRAGAHVELIIVDENDVEVPRGTVGEIISRGPHIMQGYWNKPEQTAEALRNGWMHTGDLGTMDEEGFIYIVDRLKDMIISGGENIYSTEVENAVHRHPAVEMCAVVGIPSKEWGEAVHAIVVPKAGTSIAGEEIIAHCHELIAAYKCPKSVTIRSDPLPISGAGKILKHELRSAYWKDYEKGVN